MLCSQIISWNSLLRCRMATEIEIYNYDQILNHILCIVGHLFIFILIGVIVIICTELYSHTTDTVRFYDLLLGNYLAVRTCNVSWHWEDPAEVGNTMEFTTYVSN